MSKKFYLSKLFVKKKQGKLEGGSDRGEIN